MCELFSTPLNKTKCTAQENCKPASLIMMIQFSDTLNGIQTAFFKENEYFVNLPIKETVLAIKHALEVNRLLTKADRAAYFAQKL